MQFSQLVGRAFIYLSFIFLEIFSCYAEDNIRKNLHSKIDSKYFLDDSMKKSWFDIKPVKFSNKNYNFNILKKQDDIIFNPQLQGWGVMAESYFGLINFDAAKFSLAVLGGLRTLEFLQKITAEDDVNKFKNFEDKENLILGLNASINYFFTKNTLIHMDYNFLSLGSIENLFFKDENNDPYKMDLKHNLSVGIKLSM